MDNQDKNTQTPNTVFTPTQQRVGGSFGSAQTITEPQNSIAQSQINAYEPPIIPSTNSLEGSLEDNNSSDPVTSPNKEVSSPVPSKQFRLNRAFLAIAGVAAIIVLIVGGLAGYVSRRNTSQLQSPAGSVNEQGITLGSASPDVLTVLQLKGSQNKLIVNGDLITTGRLAMASGDYFGQFVVNNLTENREYTLPDANGTVCLDVNNCNFATEGDFVSSISGVSGPLTLGSGLSLSGTTIINSQIQTTLNNFSGAVTIQGTANQVNVSNNGNVVTLSTPQDIANTSSPTFSGVTLTSLTVTGSSTSINGIAYTWPGSQLNGVLVNDGSGGLTWSAVAAACPTCFVNGGNSFGGLATLGTNDANSLVLETSGSPRMLIGSDGSVIIGDGSAATSTTVNCGTGTCSFGNNATTHSTLVGSVTGASATYLSAGTGGINIGADAVANTIQIGNGSAGVAQSIFIGNNAHAAGSSAVVLGSSANASITHIQAGTLGLFIGGGGVTNTIQIGNIIGAVAQGINIGTNATVGSTNTVTIGSTVGTSTTTLQAGSGGIVLGSISSADNTSYLCRNSSNQIASCNTTGTGAAFVQGGNSFGATATLGTNDSNSLVFETNNTTQATIAVGGATTFQNSTNSTSALNVKSSGGTNVLTVDTTNSQTSLRGTNSDAVLGSELVTSQAFNNATYWSNCNGGAGGWSGTATTTTHNTGNTVECSATASNFTVTAGATYRITFTIAGNTTATNTVIPVIGNKGGSYLGSNIAHTVVITATNTDPLLFSPDTNFNGTISNVSVKQITPANSVLNILNSSGTTTLEVRSSTNTGNTFLGLNSGRANTTGGENSATGYYALQANTTGSGNTASGAKALQANTTGSQNTATGQEALYYNTGGYSNTASGAYVLYSNTTGSQNTAIGSSALFSNTTGTDNTASGTYALYSNTTGSANTASGLYALYNNTTGAFNTAIGVSALDGNSTGSENTAIGSSALQYNSGSYNTAVGTNALNDNITGEYNTAIGYNAGYRGSQSHFRTQATQSSQTLLGKYAQGYMDNGFILGGQGADQVAGYGFGTGQPDNFMSVTPKAYNTGTVTLSSGSGFVTGSGTTFTSSMVGMEIFIGSNSSTTAPYKGTITAYTDATHISVSPNASATYSVRNYYILYPGFQVTSSGRVGIGTFSPTAQLQVNIPDAGTTKALVVNNGTSTGNILEVQDNGTNVLTVADGGAVTLQNTADSTSGFQVLDADDGTAVLVVDTTNEMVGIGAAAGNGLLTVGGATTTAAGGMYFGTDTNLYRSAADTLKTDDSLDVATRVQIGTGTGTIAQCQTIAGLLTGSCALDVNTTSTETDNITYGTNTFTTITPAGATNTVGNHGINQVLVLAGTQSFSGNNYGVDSQIYNTTTAGTVNLIAGSMGYVGQAGAGSTVTDAIGVRGGVFQSAGTLTNAYGMQIISTTGTVTNNYGLKVDGQTAGTSDYGIRVDTADTQTLWLSGDADNTTANAGIAFGASRDTNLYRSAASVLTTDDIFAVGTLGSADNTSYLCRNSSNQIASCNTTGTGAAFVQGGNSFGATATLGTNDANSLAFETNNTVRVTIPNGIDGFTFGSAGDTNLYRSGVSTLKTDDTFWPASIFTSGTARIGTTAGSLPGQLHVSTNALGTIGVVVRGVASQTANLQEWQDSAGTALSLIDENGRLGVGIANPVAEVHIADTGSNAAYLQFTNGDTGSNLSDGLTIGYNNGGMISLRENANLTFATNDTGRMYITDSGNVGIATLITGTNNRLIVNPYSTVDNLATAQINTTVATNKGLVVQGFTGQTANLQEWQNSAGAAVASISSAGTIRTANTNNVGLELGSSNHVIYFNNPDVFYQITSATGAHRFFTGSPTTERLKISATGLTTITGGSAGDALTVNNSTSTGNILNLQDNGTNIVTVSDKSAFRVVNINPALGNPIGNLGVVEINPTITLTADTGNVQYGINSSPEIDQAGYNSTASIGTIGLKATPKASGASGTVSSLTGVYSLVHNSGAGSVTNAYAITAGANLNNGGGTITNNYGIFVYNQTAGTNDYGVYIQDADTASLRLASTDGDVASGITFGGDTYLYRSAASTLYTIGSLTVAGTLSSPGAGAGSEHFGAGSLAAGAQGVSLGNLATAPGTDGVAIGYNSSSGAGANNVAIGRNSSTSNSDGVALGRGASTSGGYGIAIGSGASVANTGSIAIGTGATSTAANQVVFGSSGTNGAKTSVFFGNGVTAASPQGFTLNATGGSGTNIAGASLTLAGGQGTGTGNGGSINLQIADPGSTGASLNSLATVMSLSGTNGAATFQNTTDSATGFKVLDADGGTSILSVDTTDEQVGIGTDSAAYKLDVNDNVAGYAASFFNDGNDAGRNGIRIQAGADDGTGTTTYIDFLDGDGTEVGFCQNAAGTFACSDSSDVRTKTNIADTAVDADQILNGLRVVDFNRLQNPDGSRITGFIAQEVQALYGQAVTTGSTGYLGVARDQLVPILVKGHQNQQIAINGLDTRLGMAEAEHSQITSLEQRVGQLEAQQGQGDGSDFTTLNVSGPATIQNLTVTGTATIAQLTVTGNATFGGNITVQGHIIGNTDTRGTVTVPAGQTEVKHTFAKPYGAEPNVILTPKNGFAPSYRVEATPTDFTVYFQTPATADTQMNYQAQE